MAPISSAPVMATISSAPCKQSPLRSTSNQSEIKPAIADSVLESAAAALIRVYKHNIQVSNFEFPVQSIIQDSSFQSPVESNIQDSCFQFSVSSISTHSSISEYPSVSEFSVPLLNIDTTPDIDPEPPPWITHLCLVFIILVRFRISLWGSNSMSLSFLELSCTHELVKSSFLSFAQTVRSHRRTCLTQCFNSLE